MLFAFIPGVFLKLIDCGIHHKDPRSFITIRKQKDQFVTDIPISSKDITLGHSLIHMPLQIKNKCT